MSVLRGNPVRRDSAMLDACQGRGGGELAGGMACELAGEMAGEVAGDMAGGMDVVER